MKKPNKNAEKSTSAYIEGIRDRITACKTQDSLPWGQFVEKQYANPQVGIYGTCGATLSLSASGNQDNPDAVAALQALVDLWNRNPNDKDKKRLEQNVRLAWLFLALTFRRGLSSNEAADVFNTLIKRARSDSKLWADCGNANDQTPDKISEVSSSLILIFVFTAVLSWKKQEQVNTLTALQDHASSLQKRYLNNPGKDRPHLRILLSAIIIALGDNAKGISVTSFKDILQKNSDIGARLTHHLDSPEGRDYIVIPTSLISSLTLFQPRIPASIYLLVKENIKNIKDTLDNSNDLFNAGSTRSSTLEQGLAALALYGETINHLGNISLALANFRLFVTKERTRNERSFAVCVLFLMYVPFIFALVSVAPFESLPYIPKPLIFAWKALNDTPKSLTALLLSFATATISPFEIAKSVITGSRK